MVIVKYKFNTATDVLPTFSGNGFTYTKTDIDNGDGTKTRTIESNTNPTSISFDSKTDLIEVYEYNLKGMTSLWSAFKNCSNLIGINFTNGSINQKVNVFQAFKDCSKLKLLDLSSFTCHGDMLLTFAGCSSLTELKVPNAEVNRIVQTFLSCPSLIELDLNNWRLISDNVSLGEAFKGCVSLIKLNISNLDVSNITNINGVFFNCSSLTNLDISNWDVSNVKNFDSVFNNCSSLTNLDISNWDVGNATSMASMFRSCSSLKSLDLSNWNMSNVITLPSFEGCTNLISLNLSNWDLKKHNGYMQRNFVSCIKLKYLNMSDWKMYKPFDLDNTFNGCTNIKYIDLSRLKISRLYRTFWYCDNLECVKLPNINNINCGGMFNFTTKLKRIYFLNNSKEGLLKLNTTSEWTNTSNKGNTPSVVFVDQDMSGVTLNNNWIIDNVESTKIKLEEPLKSNSSISSPNNIVNRDFLYWNDKKSKYILSKNGVESETNHTREYVKTHTPNTYINYNLPLIYKIKLLTDTFAYELPLLPSTKYYIQLDSKCTSESNTITLNLGGTSGTLYSNLNEYATKKIELTTLPQLEGRYLKLYGNSNMVKNVMVSRQPILDYIGYADGIESFGKKVVVNGEDKYEIELTTKSKENKKIDFESKFVTIDGTSEGNDYLTINEIQGNTWQDSGNLSNIKHLGELYVDGVGNPILDSEGKEQYKYDIVSRNGSATNPQSSTKSILLPYQLKKVGDIADRLYWDNIKVKYCIEQKTIKLNSCEKNKAKINQTILGGII